MGHPALPLPGQQVAATAPVDGLEPFTRLVVLGGGPARDLVRVAVLDGDGTEYVVPVRNLTRVEA